jgi:hypothetical protein
MRPSALRASLAFLLASSAALAQAGGMRFCERPSALSATQQDKLLRFSALVKAELESSGQAVALVARSGLDLSRFGQRYSHAGFSLRGSANTAWSVRQLYYACDEEKPRIYDQGMSGFLLGADTPEIGYLSIVFLPPEHAGTVERAALDNALALQMLSPRYSANAYAFSQAYQNCNQWVAEMLAAGWGPAEPAENAGMSRAQAQAWLRDAGYQPSVFEIGWRPLQWLASLFIPWLHNDDHPAADLDQSLYRVSMPASIEALVQARFPAARRVEFCHRGKQVVIHEGWEPIAEGCTAGAQDRVLALD